eukprot:CAMPEP_0202439292 /NCGR_PEP_ID=MMETSP1345-20130828/36087_1 /ASSEMBLY_ACC=CAM_ASM_000843 /TAXON_ID=342563 /ORGANISM="Fabrea Fabrea salina" /LENGTH=54 /DNA_ID=CAMNT_0049053815 /DNA_START=1183 /DNA_END=1347 /DNA_ORIENTATION=+
MERGDAKLALWHLNQVIENDAVFEVIKGKALNLPALLSAAPPKKAKEKKKQPEA